nr:hypothetical protein [Sedimentibacter sp.]
MQKLKNISILKYGLVIVLICFIINIFVYMQFSVDEAVFLKHYYDIEIYDDTFMHINYITNSSDNREIKEIKFPQMPDNFAQVRIDFLRNSFNNGYYRTKKFAHYNYNIFSLIISAVNSNENDIAEGSVILDKAIIIYYNGDEQEVNIGKIILRKNSNRTESLTSTFVQSSSDNKATSVFISNDNFVITGINSGLDEEIKDIFKLSLNDKDTMQLNYPINVTSDDSLTFDSQFKFDLHDVRRYNVYEIQKKISLIDSEGNHENMRILNLDYYPEDLFDKENDIIKYLKEIGVK